MLLDHYNKQGLLTVTSVLGKTGTAGVSAFRGDLVLIEGALREGSATDRKPPELVIRHANLLADAATILFASGLLYRLEHLPLFIDKYRSALTVESLLLFLVENIETEMRIERDGFVFHCYPYKGGLVWNDLLDLLYIEKSDLKGQCAEDKVITVFEAAKGFVGKAPSLTYEDALTQTIEVVKEDAVGPV
ncbi:hypothetical protein [Methylotuvimicrobium sp.]|uniref:hypothetical protein n=1 Tax=Methylotuvimicrobium sp. TaxID=2822413 RepID=UPI003D657757